MKHTKYAALLLAEMAAITALTSCTGLTGGQPEKHTRDIYAMNTFMSLTAYGTNAQDALDETAERITSLEKELSVTLPDSDISRLNASGSAELGADALAIIAVADKVSRQTDGALDISIYPVVKAWGFTTGEHRIPDEQELSDLLTRVDYTQLKVSGSSVTLPEGFEIDLGALAKGYTSDCAAETIHGNGISSAILNLGGNVCAVGTKPDGTPWKVAVASPFDDVEYLGILEVQDKSVITSGKYERCFTADGKRYHHIIDPSTGYPSENGVEAVTVIGSSGVECDALSTALLVLGEEKAVEYWREYGKQESCEDGGFELLIVTSDRRLIVTSGAALNFTERCGFPMQIVE